MNGLEPEQLEELRRDLSALAGELGRQLETADEAARPVDLDQPIGRISRIDAIQQQSMARANRQAARLRLQQVRAALQRFGEEAYGLCSSCGEEVGIARLRVRPEAPFCLRCQSLRESR